MRPKSFSASALNVAELCMSRYEAEHIERGARFENDAASLGTVCHSALEQYVKHIKFEKPGHPKEWDLLVMFYQVAFMDQFGAFEQKDPRYKDGLAMLKTWWTRTDLSDTEVVSCEVKTNFIIKTSIGPIPFNYIWDRFDKLGPLEYRVVDYKSSKWNVSPDDLKQKIQARAYGLAAQIQHPDAARIWVEFDMLRHDRVSVVFTKEENKETWRFIKKLTEEIIKTEKPKETLNDECRFCVKRITCKAVLSNKNVGGLVSLDYLDDTELSDLRASVDFQMKALKQNLGEIDNHLLSRARDSDALLVDGIESSSLVKVRRTRAVDADRIRKIVGESKFLQYGGINLTIGKFDDMMKDPSIPEETKKQMKSMVFYNTGEPFISTKRKGAF